MNKKIIQNLESCSKLLTDKERILEGFSGKDLGLEPEKILTNVRLLVETLTKFFGSDERSSFFPGFISNAINEKLEGIINGLNALKEEDAKKEVTLGDVLSLMDELYAFCMQYGVITFGFQNKELQAVLEELRSHEGQVKEISEKVRDHSEKVEGKHKTVTGQSKEGKEALAQIEEAKTKSKEVLDELDKQRTAIGILKDGSQEDRAKVEALLKEVREARETSKTQFESIAKFFGDIEKSKTEMLEIKNSAYENFSVLNEDAKKKIDEQLKNSLDIIEQNQIQQKEIDSHLRKAVGISLFSAFDKRRGFIVWGKWVWAGCLALSTSAAIGVGVWIILELNKNPTIDSLFFARLVILTPIAFFIGYSATQYARERRAEEEYAFKSTISVSLDAYLKLLEEKGGGKTMSVEYVKELILEIFDNPVHRLYSAKTQEHEGIDFEFVSKTFEKLSKGTAMTVEEGMKLTTLVKDALKRSN